MMESEAPPMTNMRPQRIKRLPLKLLDGVNSSDEEAEPTAAKQVKTSKMKGCAKVKSVRSKNNSVKATATKLLAGVRKKMNNIILDLSQNHVDAEHHDNEDEDENVMLMDEPLLASLQLETEKDAPETDKRVKRVDEPEEYLLEKIKILENKIKGLEEDKNTRDRELNMLKERVKFLEDKITQFLDDRTHTQSENQFSTNSNKEMNASLGCQNANQCSTSSESCDSIPTEVDDDDKFVTLRSKKYSFKILETYRNRAYKATTLPAMVKNLAIGYLLPNRMKKQNVDLYQSINFTESQESITRNTDTTSLNQGETNSGDSIASTSDQNLSNEEGFYSTESQGSNTSIAEAIPSNTEAIDVKNKKSKPRTNKTTAEVVDVQKIARLAIRDIDQLTKLPLTRIMRHGDSTTKENKNFTSTKELYEYRKEHFTAQLELEDISTWISAAFKNFNHKKKLKELNTQRQDAEKVISNEENSNSNIQELEPSDG